MVRVLETTAIDAGRVTIQGYADSRPLTSNDTPEGRAKNRRVEISIIQPAAGAGAADALEAPRPEVQNFRENF